MSFRLLRRPRGASKLLSAACASATVVIGLSVAGPSAAIAGTANAGLPTATTSNPIANMQWGVYTGGDDLIYPTYQHARGTDKTLLAEVAQRPEAYWFGQNWKYPTVNISGYISSSTNGDSAALSQISDFSLSPWENKACGVTPSSSQIKAFKDWNTKAAKGVGNSRLLMMMQPDLAVAYSGCMTTHSRAVYESEVNWAVQKYNALKYTTVYIDTGSSDWLTVADDAKLLIASGIRDARGFALDATHYASTAQEIRYGAQIVKALSARGVRGKHFIIDTAENGNPFTHQQYTKAGFNPKQWASRPACVKGKHVRFCQTFGIPPTWQVGLSQWHLGSAAKLADEYVDGYVWFGRPWMKGQSYPFDPSLTEAMAKSTPYPYPKYVTPTP